MSTYLVRAIKLKISMTKLYFLVLCFVAAYSCSNETDISENPIPYAKGIDSSDTFSRPDSTLAGQPFDTSAIVQLDSIKVDSLSDNQTEDDESDSDSVAAEQTTPSQDSLLVVKTETEPNKETPSPRPIKPIIEKTPVITKPKPSKPAEFDYRTMNLDAYRLGERLTFDIRYGVILAGTGVMTVDKEFVYKNRIVQRVFFEAKSNSSYSWIYKVEDQYVSYLDKYGIYPWKFIQKIREGSYKKDTEVEFDQVRGIAFERGKQYKIPSYTHDIISAFYYFRNIDLKSAKPGSIIKLSNYSKGKVHPLDVRVVGWQKVKVAAGTFNCVVLEPMVKAGGLFKNEGTLFVWLTNDPLKIPVKVETKILIGSITVELSKIEGVNRAIPAKVSK